ncbi:MAG: heme-binding protein [bacterium]|nr:heme-binding protein [bacterium]
MPLRPEIGLAQARKIVDAVADAMEASGQGIAVAVVDPHGELVAFLRSDSCPLASINNAINKAFSSAREQTESASLGDRSRNGNYPLAYFGDPRYIGWGGGLPIVVDDAVIGGVGVSGLSAAEDIELAQLGLAAMG